jgi:hypothetical protein
VVSGISGRKTNPSTAIGKEMIPSTRKSHWKASIQV